jgi:hypothetical protein
VLSKQGDLSEAIRIHRETLEVQRRVLGAEHPRTLGSAFYLAVLLSEQGEFSEFARIHHETLEVRRRVLGAEHPDTLGSASILRSCSRSKVTYRRPSGSTARLALR